jgi:DNA-directed RNA polymerase beta subunit
VIINIRLRKENKYIAGDKVALRYSQKGTIARVVSAKDMPIITSGPNKGLIPDVLFNPIGYPSRRTAGLLIEGIVSKAALYSGQRQNCTAFRDTKSAYEDAQRVLEENGLSADGTEEMAIPALVGDEMKYIPLKNRIYCVPAFYQVLKHQVLDKIQMRSTGRIKPLTHQPVRGRTKRGGLRYGEMEKDAKAAHGASGCLMDRMLECSDKFEVRVCRSCGNLINSPDEVNECKCKKSSPGVLTIPYIFKLFIQQIQTMGIDMRMKLGTY